jgi:hypothetical protein
VDTCGVLVGTDAGGVDDDDPLQVAERVRLGLRVGQQLILGAVLAPADQPVVAGLPRAVPLRQVAPRRPGPELPQDPVQDGAVIPPAPAALAVAWQQRRKLRPCLAGHLAHPETAEVIHAARFAAASALIEEADAISEVTGTATSPPPPPRWCSRLGEDKKPRHWS